MKTKHLIRVGSPLKNGNRGTRLCFVRKVFLFCVTLCFGGLYPLSAAPDFKIRYNQKFPCLEVMDSKAVKITDITEGAKGETVTSGKSSISISFSKNDAGQPEVVLSEAKSSLSEMEVEAFGLSVGLKPEGTVLVRFGADNKPKFEMDRTGGARFLMADLGNLDTAAGKELAVVPSAGPTDPSSAAATTNGPSKSLTRFRERLAAWKGSQGKGGWSNKPGKVLMGGMGWVDAMVTYTNQPARKLLSGEAIQTGADVQLGTTASLQFSSGPGVFHQILPGARFSVAPLEQGQTDVKITLQSGTIQTYVVTPLVAPRMHVEALGNGVVVQTADGLFEITKTPEGEARLTVAEGSVRLVEQAGAAQVAEVQAGRSLKYPAEKTSSPTPKEARELAELAKMKAHAADAYLVDMAMDAIQTASTEVEEVVKSVSEASPRIARITSGAMSQIRPDLYDAITKFSGILDLPNPSKGLNLETANFAQRAKPWLRAEPSPLSAPGKVLLVNGNVTDGSGLPIKRSQVLKQGQVIQTPEDGRLLMIGAPGILVEIEAGSEVRITEQKRQFEHDVLMESKIGLETIRGEVNCAVVEGYGSKIKAEIKTAKGTQQFESMGTKASAEVPPKGGKS